MKVDVEEENEHDYQEYISNSQTIPPLSYTVNPTTWCHY